MFVLSEFVIGKVAIAMEIVYLSCTDGAAVYVHGEGANPRVKKCDIHHSNCVGVYVEDHAGVSQCSNYTGSIYLVTI